MSQNYPKPRSRNRLMPACIALASVVGFSPTVSAQMLEEVIVTAQKREENVQDVPIAVTVLNEELIESAYSNNMESLQQLVPSVSFRKGNTTRNSAITVRGIGTISFSIAAEPSVSTVVDGVVLGRSGQAFSDLYDIERLEVLRGPQGTLFGKNASAGVVNITTRKPSEEFEGYADLGIFEDSEYRAKLRLSGPLSDNVRGSLNVFYGDFDGYITNTFTGDDVQGYERFGLRGMLDWDVNDTTLVRFIAEYYDADDSCCADLEGLPSGRNPSSPAAPDSNGVVNGVADIDLGQRLIDHDFNTTTEDSTDAISMIVETAFGEYDFVSVTAYRNWENTEFREGDFTSIAGDSDQPVFGVPFQLHDIGPQEWDQFSQEFRLISPVGDTFNWQLGAFYWSIESDRQFTRDASCQNNAGQNDAILAANPGLTCNANDIVSATAVMSTEFENWALFADGKYNINDNFRIFAGLRFTSDDVEFTHVRTSNDQFGRQGVGVRPATLNTNFANDTDETELSGRLGAEWNFNDSGMVYASYARGYKGPAFNVFYNMGPNDTLPIDKETSDAFEVGLKFTADTWLANIALFTTDIEGFQANNFDTSMGTTITRLTNAGDVSTEGIEFDFIWNPTEALSLTGGFAYVNAEIDEFLCPIGENCTTRSGLDVPFAPEFKASLNANYVWDLENFDVVLNAAYVHVDEQFSTLPSNSGTFPAETLLPSYDQFHASLGFNFDDKYVFTLVGRNLTDEEYVTTYSGDGFRYQIPRDADRYFGVNLRANF